MTTVTFGSTHLLDELLEVVVWTMRNDLANRGWTNTFHYREWCAYFLAIDDEALRRVGKRGWSQHASKEMRVGTNLLFSLFTILVKARVELSTPPFKGMVAFEVHGDVTQRSVAK
jgi:hypothetical protein